MIFYLTLTFYVGGRNMTVIYPGLTSVLWDTGVSILSPLSFLFYFSCIYLTISRPAFPASLSHLFSYKSRLLWNALFLPKGEDPAVWSSHFSAAQMYWLEWEVHHDFQTPNKVWFNSRQLTHIYLYLGYGISLPFFLSWHQKKKKKRIKQVCW